MFTFTYEVMFLPRFVCLFVGLSVSRIILKTLWMMNSHEMFTSVASGTKKNRYSLRQTHSDLGVTRSAATCVSWSNYSRAPIVSSPVFIQTQSLALCALRKRRNRDNRMTIPHFRRVLSVTMSLTTLLRKSLLYFCSKKIRIDEFFSL